MIIMSLYHLFHMREYEINDEIQGDQEKDNDASDDRVNNSCVGVG